jgi:hypothetical protein
MITRQNIDWLIPGWIPLGKLTVLDGDPGLGKSTFLADITARVSSHGIGFNQRQGPTGDVIFLSAEDCLEDTVRPRLEAAGANLERIHTIRCMVQGEEERPVEIPADLPFIDDMIDRYKAKLFILEPLAAYLCGADANKDQEIRRVLYKLSRIAEKRNCAVITMRHLNKHMGGKAIYRGNMSIGVIGHARVGLLVAEDPDDQEKRILAMPKINCGPRQQSLRFGLEVVPELEVCRIAWLGTSPYYGDELLAEVTPEKKEQQQYEASKLETCTQLLNAILQEANRQKLIRAVKQELVNAGYSQRTIERAAAKLGCEVIREADGTAPVYSWRLPATATPESAGGLASCT